MHKFQDHKGDDWALKLSVSTARRVKRETGVDLLEPTRGKWDGLKTALSNETTLAEVLYVMCAGQAEQRGLDEEDFLDRFCDAEIVESAAVALLKALIDYFPTRMRPPLERMLRTIDGTLADRRKRGVAALEAHIDSPEFETLLDRVIDDQLPDLADEPKPE